MGEGPSFQSMSNRSLLALKHAMLLPPVQWTSTFMPRRRRTPSSWFAMAERETTGEGFKSSRQVARS